MKLEPPKERSSVVDDWQEDTSLTMWRRLRRMPKVWSPSLPKKLDGRLKRAVAAVALIVTVPLLTGLGVHALMRKKPAPAPALQAAAAAPKKNILKVEIEKLKVNIEGFRMWFHPPKREKNMKICDTVVVEDRPGVYSDGPNARMGCMVPFVLDKFSEIGVNTGDACPLRSGPRSAEKRKAMAHANPGSHKVAQEHSKHEEGLAGDINTENKTIEEVAAKVEEAINSGAVGIACYGTRKKVGFIHIDYALPLEGRFLAWKDDHAKEFSKYAAARAAHPDWDAKRLPKIPAFHDERIRRWNLEETPPLIANLFLAHNFVLNAKREDVDRDPKLAQVLAAWKAAHPKKPDKHARAKHLTVSSR